MISEALRDLIVAEADITDRLATWQFTSGVDAPAVFTTNVIPDGAAYPAIIINEAGGPDWGTMGFQGADLTIRVRLYGDKVRETPALRDIAWDVRRLLNRQRLTVTDTEVAMCVANPPDLIGDEDGFPGYLISLRVLVLEVGL